jgi:hypothetical protein
MGCLAANREAHAFHPIAHRPAERHFAAAGAGFYAQTLGIFGTISIQWFKARFR